MFGSQKIERLEKTVEALSEDLNRYRAAYVFRLAHICANTIMKHDTNLFEKTYIGLIKWFESSRKANQKELEKELAFLVAEFKNFESFEDLHHFVGGELFRPFDDESTFEIEEWVIFFEKLFKFGVLSKLSNYYHSNWHFYLKEQEIRNILNNIKNLELIKLLKEANRRYKSYKWNKEDSPFEGRWNAPVLYEDYNYRVEFQFIDPWINDLILVYCKDISEYGLVELVVMDDDAATTFYECDPKGSRGIQIGREVRHLKT